MRALSEKGEVDEVLDADCYIHCAIVVCLGKMESHCIRLFLVSDIEQIY